MTTKTQDGKLVTRAMALAAKEGNGVGMDRQYEQCNHVLIISADYIFHANSESGKTDDLEANSEVNLGFLNNSTLDETCIMNHKLTPIFRRRVGVRVR